MSGLLRQTTLHFYEAPAHSPRPLKTFHLRESFPGLVTASFMALTEEPFVQDLAQQNNK